MKRCCIPDADINDNIDMNFVQTGGGDYFPGTDGASHDYITFYGCQRKDHYHDKFPTALGSPHVQLLQVNEYPNPYNDVDNNSTISFVLIDDDLEEKSDDESTDSGDVFVYFYFFQIRVPRLRAPPRTRHVISPNLILLDSESTVYI